MCWIRVDDEENNIKSQAMQRFVCHADEDFV